MQVIIRDLDGTDHIHLNTSAAFIPDRLKVVQKTITDVDDFLDAIANSHQVIVIEEIENIPGRLECRDEGSGDVFEKHDLTEIRGYAQIDD